MDSKFSGEIFFISVVAICLSKYLGGFIALKKDPSALKITALRDHHYRNFKNYLAVKFLNIFNDL